MWTCQEQLLQIFEKSKHSNRQLWVTIDYILKNIILYWFENCFKNDVQYAYPSSSYGSE